MKKPNKKLESEIPQRKEGRPIREVVPPTSNKPPREPNPILFVDNFNRTYSCTSEPFYSFPEWPGDDVVKVRTSLYNLIEL